jgi:hypothetical protein
MVSGKTRAYLFEKAFLRRKEEFPFSTSPESLPPLLDRCQDEGGAFAGARPICDRGAIIYYCSLRRVNAYFLMNASFCAQCHRTLSFFLLRWFVFRGVRKTHSLMVACKMDVFRLRRTYHRLPLIADLITRG